MAPPKAVVLLSGGLDSTVCLHQALADGFVVHALSVRYGQRHAEELAAAAACVASLPVVQHLILDLDLRAMGGSALTSDLPVPKGGLLPGIPSTYVPARNTILLSLALGWAESLGAQAIYLGINAVDFSGYPDCRPAFLEAFQHLTAVATKAGVEGRPIELRAPLLHLGKPDIVRLGLKLGVDFAHTRSCYDPEADGTACGLCDACRLRLGGFAVAGVADPLPYRQQP